ncbi:MAG: DNA-directed RNA polymerase subunit alpha [Candidatus Levybacteria bacterium RIFCSPLOWO2_01_FULL_38_13]|nr:MAG: DNA-directed RNA polymerase subunit alpha [Candidatus Levybacteria bacterium RIFCSPHIGHO2_01_FULL_41_15]OGH34751.1 MAG: DNA-directed RNA polymerase subunit alpha [Candidatus Levybacteria bacterium RIFCSPLOWO2_01_FULL_38_13]
MLDPVLKVKEEKIEKNFGEFVIEPLEPGYGHTLGNSLRRVLLSSIPGAAVTSVKISGVRHKFSTIPGLKENVVDLLLNIKDLNLKLLDSKTSSVMKLSVKGPKKITAQDLELPEDIEVANKDHYLGHLSDSKAKIDIELTVERGLGYSLAEERKASTIGVIPTDAIFTPVRRVNYEVSATRVGRQTDLDKLTIRVWTNGAVSPRDALNEGGRILSSYFSQIFQPKSVPSDSISVSPSIPENVLNLTIDELDLPTRIYNSLRNGDVETFGDLLSMPRKELMSMRNMGSKSVAIIGEKLKEREIELPQ